jgi:hypothetical protein
VCIDFRALNAVTESDKYPSPNASIILETAAGYGFYTTLDAEKGYYQILMGKLSSPMTAFSCADPVGHYMWVRMPFGLKNAGATFQRRMNAWLVGLNMTVCLVFIDDIVIFSMQWKEHLRDVGAVFERLRKYGVVINWKKVTIGQPSCMFLGFIVGRAGVSPDPAKVEKIRNMVRPVTSKQLTTFLGMAGYLRRFIRDFAAIMTGKPVSRKNWLNDIIKK